MSIKNKRPSIPNQNFLRKTSLLSPDVATANSSYLDGLKPKSIKSVIFTQTIDATNIVPNKNTLPPAPYAGYVDASYVLVDYVENTL
jgi:hypothetical protein